MVPIICLTNQKGGVGKTTSSDAIADGLRRRGKRVLAIDTDPQGSLGAIEARYIVDGTCCCSSFFKGSDLIPTEEGQAVVPGDFALSFIQGARDSEGRPLTEYSLRDAIDEAVERHGFDAVVIDTQPGMSFLTISALAAATHVVIPTTADALGVEALAQDLAYFEDLSGAVELRWESEPGVLITQYRGMARLAQVFADQIEHEMPNHGMRVFYRRIPINVMIQEAQANRVSIYDQEFFRGGAGRKVMQAAAAEYDMLVEKICTWIWPVDNQEQVIA